MPELLALLVWVSALVAVLGGLSWLAIGIRRRGLGGPLMGPFDEIWHPAAHVARLEIREQTERGAPSASPEDL